MRLNWSQYVAKNSVSLPTLHNVSDWMSEVAEAAAFVTPLSVTEERIKRNRDFTCAAYQNKSIDRKEDNKKYKCLICKQKCSRWDECSKFLKLNVDERWKLVTKFKRCFSCLNEKHQVRHCEAKERCQKDGCEMKHHRLLHNDKKVLTGSKNNTVETLVNEFDTSDKKNDKYIVGHQAEKIKNMQVWLRVIPVTLIGKNGNRIKVCALLDEASTVTLIDSKLADDLQLEGRKDPINIAWTNDQTYYEENSRTFDIEIEGDGGQVFTLQHARTISNLRLPTQTISEKQIKLKWPYLKNIPFNTITDKKPQLLIGQDNIDLTIAREVVQGPINSPIASRTRLGWTVHGPTSRFQHRVDKEFSLHIYRKTDDEELITLMKKMFECDFPDFDKSSTTMTDEDERAMQIIENTCRQTKDKHWEVGLLWKDDNRILPESRRAALKRLYYVEKRMDSNDKLRKQYCEQVNDYLRKGYARVLTKEEIEENHDNTWYLPHFPVQNPRKPDKFRFVFDASSKSNGQSLNDNLLAGPDLFNNLICLLFKFRQYKFAFVADIQEMFLQVKIRKEDQWALRFLWRGEERVEKPKEMIMQVMIFGAICSPTLAMYVTRKNAESFENEYPEAVNAIKTKYYMDDYLESTETLEEAITRANEVIQIFEAGGFNLRNFISNSADLLKHINPDKLSKNMHPEVFGMEVPPVRVLGLSWDCSEDKFSFNSTLLKQREKMFLNDRVPTKREVLQVVMSVFDPLGFLSLITLKGRVLMQEIWKSKLNWDEPLSDDLTNQWKVLMQELNDIKTMTIPRSYTGDLLGLTDIQLHIFCDASTRGYAAVGYLRLVDSNDYTKVVFVLAKSRVAPVKTLTIPRLELQAAVLGARLGKLILEGHTLTIKQTYYWTDSAITWHRLRGDPNKFTVYISRRIREIQTLTTSAKWRWLPSENNVADLATRVTKITREAQNLWFKGPDFLPLDKQFWPKMNTEIKTSIEDTEIRTNFVLTVHPQEMVIDFTRFSNYNRVTATMGWVIRFIDNLKHKTRTKKTNRLESLTAEDLKRAELVNIKMAQIESFPEEYHLLTCDKPLSKNSKIYCLSPLLEDGLIRMNGRANRSKELTPEARRPPILDAKHRLTKLLIRNYHVKYAHQGQETVINQLKHRFWIINVRSAVRSCSRACIECQRKRGKPACPQMAPLPPCRVTRYERPFTCVGLDYFGPIEVKIGRRREKRYGALFTCMTIRAVHVEIVSSLTADGTIMALRRMSARRGYPKEIYSDNATNFRGAERELLKAIKNLDNNLISLFCAGRGIKWIFNTPAAPHMGGCWERMVRSVKTALSFTLKEKVPKEETLSTALCEIENIINSRPLTYVSVDPNDDDSLSPNDILIGKKCAIPNFNTELCIKKQWQVAQNLADNFWARWVKEYLPTLGQRKKWQKDSCERQVGDMVRIMDDNQPRNIWLTGIVEKIYPGQDGKVRTVDVKTKFGTYRRPVLKLIKINLNENFV